MTGDNRLSKLEILIQQEKFTEAGKMLLELLGEDPNNVDFLSLLAEINLEQDNLDVADSMIDDAIGLSPDTAHLFYVKSRIALQREKLEEAESSIGRAINLDPHDADHFALLSHIKMARKQFEGALETANRALEIDAGNLLALNTRSTALNKLNRKTESLETMETALREDPNNAFTHANHGWSLLENGDCDKALEHFKEALSHDPDSGHARDGMLEALKAKNPIYRLYLKYSIWMGNLAEKYQWGVIIGFYLGFRAIRTIARNNEALQPYFVPMVVVLALIAFSTWVMAPMGNLFLRFNRYGVLLLGKKERMGSSLVAIGLCTFLVGLVLYLALSDQRMLGIAVFGFAMMVPLGTMLLPSKSRYALLVYTIALAVVGLTAIGLTFFSGGMFNTFTMLFIFGFMGYQWVANHMIIGEANF